MVRRGGCFRIPHRELSAAAGGANRRRGDRGEEKPPHDHFPGGIAVPSPGEAKGCLTCSSVRRSDWCVSCVRKMTRGEARFGGLETRFDLFIWQRNTARTANQSRLQVVAVQWPVLSCMLEHNKQSRLRAEQACVSLGWFFCATVPQIRNTCCPVVCLLLRMFTLLSTRLEQPESIARESWMIYL